MAESSHSHYSYLVGVVSTNKLVHARRPTVTYIEWSKVRHEPSSHARFDPRDRAPLVRRRKANPRRDPRLGS